jgi:hypothetical protein
MMANNQQDHDPRIELIMKSHGLHVDKLQFVKDGQTYDLLSSLPKGWKAKTGNIKTSANPDTRTICIEDQTFWHTSALDALVSDLHEIGHAVDIEKNGYGPLVNPAQERYQIPLRDVTYDDLSFVLRLECAAWIYMMSALKEYGFGNQIREKIYEDHVLKQLQGHLEQMDTADRVTWSDIPCSPLEIAAQNSEHDYATLKQRIIAEYELFEKENRPS